MCDVGVFFILMNSVEQIAQDLISQYGDDAQAIAMLRAAEFAASMNTEEWKIWEAVLIQIEQINANPSIN